MLYMRFILSESKIKIAILLFVNWISIFNIQSLESQSGKTFQIVIVFSIGFILSELVRVVVSVLTVYHDCLDRSGSPESMPSISHQVAQVYQFIN